MLMVKMTAGKDEASPQMRGASESAFSAQHTRKGGAGMMAIPMEAERARRNKQGRNRNVLQVTVRLSA